MKLLNEIQVSTIREFFTNLENVQLGISQNKAVILLKFARHISKNFEINKNYYAKLDLDGGICQKDGIIAQDFINMVKRDLQLI